MTMKKILAFLFTFTCFLATQAQNQISIPEAPKKIEFANILVELSPEALKNVNTEINNLLTPQNKFLEQKLERMQWYFPIIEKILEEEDIPEDLKYLAVMESSLLPEAISSSNAVGFWQFKEATAKEVGLRVDNNQDDRKNIYLSTKGAALYMKRNNLIFKNWISCLLAYNLGVQGATDKIPVDWSFASEIKFDENTHPYLIKALAHRIAYEHRLNRLKESPRKFVEYKTKGKSLAEIAVELTTDINELRKYNPWLYAPNIPEDKDYTVLVLSRIEDVDEITSKIQKRLDAKSVDVGFPQLKRITMVSTSPDAPIFYEINGKKGILAQPGDEVAQMASKSKMKIGKLLSLNDMKDKDLAKEGNIYYLQKKNKKAKVPYHTVSGEQTLWDISQMYGIRMKYLLKYNRMKTSQRLQPGRVIWMQKTRPKNQPIEIIQEAIPEKDKLPIKEKYESEEVTKNTTPTKKDRFEEIEKKPEESKPKNDGLDLKDPIFGEAKPAEKPSTPVEKPKPPVEKPKPPVERPKPVIKEETLPERPSSTSKVATHNVKQGETMFSIAKRYGLTVDQLRKLNNMSPNETLRYNQTLIVGKASTRVRDESIGEIPEETKVVKKPTEVERPKPTERPRPTEVEESPTRSSALTHTVAPGETLFSISKKYDVSVRDIQEWNNLGSNSIKLGQRLKVSAGKVNTSTRSSEPRVTESRASEPKTETKRSSGTFYHEVAPNETLYSISRKYGVTVNEIKNWNNLSDNNVKLGSKIIVKK